jgi:hypothetical protein
MVIDDRKPQFLNKEWGFCFNYFFIEGLMEPLVPVEIIEKSV